VQEFLAKNGATVVPHPSLSPHLASCDSPFPKLRLTLKGRKFEDIAIQKQSQDTLPKFKTKDFCKWHECWAHYIKSHRNYFEGDSMN
jgi:hypothetical protein